MNRKTYKIGDKEFFTAELTLAQDEQVFDLLKEIGVADFFDVGVFNTKKMLGALGQNKKMREFLATILIPVNAEYDETKLDEMRVVAGKLTNAQIIEVCEDFFGYNRSSFQKFESYFLRFWKKIEAKIDGLAKLAQKAESLKPGS